MESTDSRTEHRTKIDITALPFLGSRKKDWSSFVYYLIDLSGRGLQIGVAPETGGTDKALEKTDVLDLHLALRSDKGIFHRGKISWTNWDANKGLLLCGIALEKKLPASEKITGSPGSFYVSLFYETSDIILETSEFDSADALLLSLLEGSVVIKTGMPKMLDKTLAFLKKTGHSGLEDPHAIIHRIKERVREDVTQLQAHSNILRDHATSTFKNRVTTQLDDLQTLMRPKVYSSLTKLSPNSALKEPVLGCIMDLERQLCVNYNTIALLWLGYLAYAYQNLEIPLNTYPT